MIHTGRELTGHRAKVFWEIRRHCLREPGPGNATKDGRAGFELGEPLTLFGYRSWTHDERKVNLTTTTFILAVPGVCRPRGKPPVDAFCVRFACSAKLCIPFSVRELGRVWSINGAASR